MLYPKDFNQIIFGEYKHLLIQIVIDIYKKEDKLFMHKIFRISLKLIQNQLLAHLFQSIIQQINLKISEKMK